MGLSLSNDACYAALSSRDARFDGQFLVAVSSTRIYCRPVCRVRLPAQKNCRFFETAAQAEANGYRPCLRCRPELATRWCTHSISESLAIHAIGLFDHSFTETGAIANVSARLGISERHLRRLLNEHLGVSPTQYLQTRRLLFAKQLLTDTDLAIAEIALMSGFGSVRRFNTAVQQVYRLTPSAIRQSRTRCSVVPTVGADCDAQDAILCQLKVQPPFDFDLLLAFHERHAISTIESVENGVYTRAVAYSSADSNQQLSGWYRLRAINESQLHLEVSRSLIQKMSSVIATVKAQFDLDANPHHYLSTLGPLAAQNPGIRVPGGVTGFEVAVRAILGQHISVAAGTRCAVRLVQQLGGEGIQGGPARTFPTPDAVASCPSLSFSRMGISEAKTVAIKRVATLISEGSLVLNPGADVSQTTQSLMHIDGIEPYAVNTVLMRALRWPDAFVSTHPELEQAAAAQGVNDINLWADQFKPWRAYAAMHLWHSQQLNRRA